MTREEVETRFEDLLRKKILSELTPAEKARFARLQTLRRRFNPRSAEEIRNDESLHYKTRLAIKMIRSIAYHES